MGCELAVGSNTVQAQKYCFVCRAEHLDILIETFSPSFFLNLRFNNRWGGTASPGLESLVAGKPSDNSSRPLGKLDQQKVTTDDGQLPFIRWLLFRASELGG